jgi:hypothetical protein
MIESGRECSAAGRQRDTTISVGTEPRMYKSDIVSEPSETMSDLPGPDGGMLRPRQCQEIRRLAQWRGGPGGQPLISCRTTPTRALGRCSGWSSTVCPVGPKMRGTYS